jgi:hypothetical protein
MPQNRELFSSISILSHCSYMQYGQPMGWWHEPTCYIPMQDMFICFLEHNHNHPSLCWPAMRWYWFDVGVVTPWLDTSWSDDKCSVTVWSVPTENDCTKNVGSSFLGTCHNLECGNWDEVSTEGTYQGYCESVKWLTSVSVSEPQDLETPALHEQLQEEVSSMKKPQCYWSPRSGVNPQVPGHFHNEEC